jgi:hypothetical protein
VITRKRNKDNKLASHDKFRFPTTKAKPRNATGDADQDKENHDGNQDNDDNQDNDN